MPLVRKPGAAPAGPEPDAARIAQALHSADAEERWSAARAAGTVPGVQNALAQALPVETNARVREAMLTSLARIGSPTSIEPLLSMIRSDQAALRTAALDALRLTPHLIQVIRPLLEDPDTDVRLLSCDLVRALPAAQANAALVSLLEKETHPNVCSAAVEVLAEVGEPVCLAALETCARRFSDNQFLLFAIKTVSERLRAAPAGPRA